MAAPLKNYYYETMEETKTHTGFAVAPVKEEKEVSTHSFGMSVSKIRYRWFRKI
jgi:hypothetical protein